MVAVMCTVPPLYVFSDNKLDGTSGKTTVRQECALIRRCPLTAFEDHGCIHSAKIRVRELDKMYLKRHPTL